MIDWSKLLDSIPGVAPSQDVRNISDWLIEPNQEILNLRNDLSDPNWWTTDHLTPWVESLFKGGDNASSSSKSASLSDLDKAAQNWGNYTPADQQALLNGLNPADRAYLQALVSAQRGAGTHAPGLNAGGILSGTQGTDQTKDSFTAFVNAIVQQESGGNYGALGIETGGDRAYGKYQIMGRNIPGWSRQILGYSITPEQFMASHQLQDEIGQGILAKYYRDYGGAYGAAAAWYAGPGWQQEDPNAPQYGGPSIAGYANSVLAHMADAGAPAGPDMAGSAATAAPGYDTPDGHHITSGSTEDSFYQMADSLWTKVYGTHAPWSVVQAMEASGVKTLEQMSVIIDEMPSDIPGVSIGVRGRVKTDVQKLADKYLGRPVPDSLVKELIGQGVTTPGQIQLWWDSHPAKDIPKEDYQAIFDQGAQYLKDPYNTVPHPSQVASIYSDYQGVHGTAGSSELNAQGSAPDLSTMPLILSNG